MPLKFEITFCEGFDNWFRDFINKETSPWQLEPIVEVGKIKRYPVRFGNHQIAELETCPFTNGKGLTVQLFQIEESPSNFALEFFSALSRKATTERWGARGISPPLNFMDWSDSIWYLTWGVDGKNKAIILKELTTPLEPIPDLMTSATTRSNNSRNSFKMNWNMPEGQILKLAYDKYLESGMNLFGTEIFEGKVRSFGLDANDYQKALRRLGRYIVPSIGLGQSDIQAFQISDDGLRLCEEEYFSSQQNSEAIPTASIIHIHPGGHMGDKFEIKAGGNIQNLNIKSNNVRQTIQAMPNTNQTIKDEITELFNKLIEELEKAPAEMATEASKVIERAEEAIKEASVESPDKEDVEASEGKLKRAAQNFAAVTPQVVYIATQFIEALHRGLGG